MNQPGCHLGCQPRGFCWMLLPSKDVYSCTIFFLARSQDMFLNVLIRWSKVCFWYEAGKLQQKKQKQLEEEVVDEVEKSSLLSGLVVNFEFPKGVMSNVYVQQWVVFSSRYFVVVSGFWKHVHLVSWYKTAGIFTCTGTHFFPRKIGRWWQVIFEMNTQNREFLETFKLKEHLADLGIQIPSDFVRILGGANQPNLYVPWKSSSLFQFSGCFSSSGV